MDFLAEIEREADRLAVLIGDLLELSRIESGGLDSHERAPARVGDLVAGGLDRVRGLFDERSLTVEVPTELPPVVVDAAQLERVVANLLENTARYAPPDSAVRVLARTAGEHIEMRVEDRGPGIPPDHLDHVFDKFFPRARFGALRHPRHWPWPGHLPSDRAGAGWSYLGRESARRRPAVCRRTSSRYRVYESRRVRMVRPAILVADHEAPTRKYLSANENRGL